MLPDRHQSTDVRRPITATWCKQYCRFRASTRRSVPCPKRLPSVIARTSDSWAVVRTLPAASSVQRQPWPRIGGCLLLIGAGLPARPTRPVYLYMGRHYSQVLLELLLPYAPQVNPTKDLCAHLKTQDLTNLWAIRTTPLHHVSRLRLRSTPYRPTPLVNAIMGPARAAVPRSARILERLYNGSPDSPRFSPAPILRTTLRTTGDVSRVTKPCLTPRGVFSLFFLRRYLSNCGAPLPQEFAPID